MIILQNEPSINAVDPNLTGNPSEMINVTAGIVIPQRREERLEEKNFNAHRAPLTLFISANRQ